MLLGAPFHPSKEVDRCRFWRRVPSVPERLSCRIDIFSGWGEGFVSSDDKKLWEKPDLQSFANADEAIAYYSARGMHEHVAAVKRMVAEAERRRVHAEERRFRAAGRR